MKIGNARRSRRRRSWLPKRRKRRRRKSQRDPGEVLAGCLAETWPALSEEDREPDLELARYNIDMIEAIEQKTKGNLTPEEQELLKNTLSDLRMGYVNIANQLSSQQ
jgi:hypothetical protein